MQEAKGEVWSGSWLTRGDDLETLKRRREWVRTWEDKEALETVNLPIKYHNFFIQFKDMTLATYLFNTWTELEGMLYDNYITVSAKADYVNNDLSFHLLKYDNVIVGYAAKVENQDYYAHINSRFELTASPSETNPDAS